MIKIVLEIPIFKIAKVHPGAIYIFYVCLPLKTGSF